MSGRSVSTAVVAAATAALLLSSAQAQNAASEAAKYDPAKYPDWSGQWRRPGAGPNKYDPTKPPGLPQEAPLTAEYLKIFEDGLKDQEAGGQGTALTYSCLPFGMPRVMAGNQGLEFVVTPKTTHVIFVNAGRAASIPTAATSRPTRTRPSPAIRSASGSTPTATASSTRSKSRPATSTGRARSTMRASRCMPTTRRSSRSASIATRPRPNVLHNEMTTIDHAFTRPWSVHKVYQLQKKPNWVENECTVGNQHVMIGKEGYYLSADGYLMPVKKGQAPPDLRYFGQSRK